MTSKRHFDEPFQLYHLSSKVLDGKELCPRPLARDRVMEGENWKIPRICVSNSIDGAVSALVDSLSCSYGLTYWVHVPLNLIDLFNQNKVHRPSTRQVPDAEVTGEHWLKAPTVFKAIGQIEILDINKNHELYYMWNGEKTRMDRFNWKWLMKI